MKNDATMPEGVSPEALKELTDMAKAKAKEVMGKIPALGPITWLMMQQSATRHTLLSELEWRVMPPLVIDQAKLYMREQAPLAFASWALLSDEVAKRYQEKPHQLTPADWKSGDQVWLVDVFTPYGGAPEVLKDLRESVHKGKVIHQLIPQESGKAQVMRWPAQ